MKNRHLAVIGWILMFVNLLYLSFVFQFASMPAGCYVENPLPLIHPITWFAIILNFAIAIGLICWPRREQIKKKFIEVFEPKTDETDGCK